jgi:hypothetical protein
MVFYHANLAFLKVLNIRHQSEMFNRKREKPGEENPGRTGKRQPTILPTASGWSMIRA